MKHVRTQDQVKNTGTAAPDALSPHDFSGTWFNTNTESPGITCVTCNPEDGGLRVRFEGNGSSEPRDWGEATAELLCAAAIQGGPAMSFVASFDLGFKKALAGGNLNQGLLVIAVYHSLQNSSDGGSNYFSREFFRRGAQS